ncbi:MAG: ROK family protein [Bacillota bacterium]|nr:ROK family protein [Bacillota bacterium]
MKMTLDIGGTKTLWTVWNDGIIIDRGTAATNRIGDFFTFIKTLINDFTAGHSDCKITDLSFALAGPVTDDKFELTNTKQVIDLAELRDAFADINVIFLNDLEALAHSIDHLTMPDQLALFRSAASDAKGAKAVISIGTGLGVSAVSREGIIIPSEGGHVDFAPIGAKQHMIYERLSKQYGHVSYERLLSGQGVSNIFGCLLEEPESGGSDAPACRPRQKMHPAQITALAKSGNLTALEAFHIFTEILGAACGNYALVYNSCGGIYIGGGMLPKILPLLDKDVFEKAFLNKGRFNDLLQNIPVYAILDETAPSIGAMKVI